MQNTDRLAKIVMFCATQRSGSTVIHDDLLNLLGQRAINAEILFDHILRDRTTRLWPELWADICDEFTVGGILALKVMFHYTPHIARFMRGEMLGETSPVRGFDPADFDAFHVFFADAVWVSVRRRDAVAQAVSIYIAEQTGQWHAYPDKEEETPPAPAYDGVKLQKLLTGFIKERQQWDAFFAHYGITPVMLDYDDAVQNYPAYMDGLLDRLGREPVQPAPPRRYLKLGGALNEQFAARLRAEAGHLFSPQDLL